MQAGPGSAKGKQNIPGAPPPKKHSPRLGIAARLVQAAAILHLGGPGGSKVGSCPAMPQPLALTFRSQFGEIVGD